MLAASVFHFGKLRVGDVKAELSRVYGLKAGTEWRTKTTGKTRRDLSSWEWRGAYLPLTAAVPGAHRIAV